MTTVCFLYSNSLKLDNVGNQTKKYQVKYLNNKILSNSPNINREVFLI